MKIALATPSIPKSLHEGLNQLSDLVGEAAQQRAEIVCFPESFLPGYPGMGYTSADRTKEALTAAFAQACLLAAHHKIMLLLPMDWYFGDQLFNVVHVISPEGKLMGTQTKNQLDPSEDNEWEAGIDRQLFEINKVKFGITICHEGFRYPEATRYCAVHGAQIVFHAFFAGSNEEGTLPSSFGSMDHPYYEKAFIMRAVENTIYFAAVNYASKYQEAASAVIAPNGSCIAHQPYGQNGVLIVDIDPAQATALLAKRFKPQLHYP